MESTAIATTHYTSAIVNETVRCCCELRETVRPFPLRLLFVVVHLSGSLGGSLAVVMVAASRWCSVKVATGGVESKANTLFVGAKMALEKFSAALPDCECYP